MNAWNRKQKGSAAEDAAARYLEAAGYRLLERNWRCRSGEIDIIASLGHTLVFVEVRSRSGEGELERGTPEESVGPDKMRRIRGTAELYLKGRETRQAELAFDLIAVRLGAEGSVLSLRHYRNAF